MALPLPETSKEISQRAKVDVRRELGTSNPFLRRSYLGAIIVGVCNRVFEFYAALREVELEGNPATAIRNLKRWASIWRIFPLPGSPSSGSLFVAATLAGSGKTIANGTRFVATDGAVYVSNVEATVGFVGGTISSLTASGGIATAVSAGHGLASNATLTITGAGVAGFDDAATPITVVDEDTFTYEVADALSGSAGGTPIWTSLGAVVPIVSEGAGSDRDLDSDTPLAFESGPAAGISSPAFVAYPGVTDGAAPETDDALRARMLFRIRNPTAQFNRASITAKALEVGGVTRVFVQEATPAIGQTRVYFLRDGDSTPIPDAAEVAAVKASILTIKPATTSDADVIVAAPTAVPADFTFTAISPNTQSMKDAVRATLIEFFKLKTNVGDDVVEEAYTAAIYNTRDPVTGDAVESFTLSAPSGDISISAGEIATLGTVSGL